MCVCVNTLAAILVARGGEGMFSQGFGIFEALVAQTLLLLAIVI